MLTLTIPSYSAAFGDHWADRDAELARILHQAAKRIEDATCDEYGVEIPLHDINGNRVGSFIIGEAAAPDDGPSPFFAVAREILGG